MIQDISTERVIQKIRDLRDSQQWHESLLPTFDSWEESLKSLEIDAEFLELPKVKELAGMLESRLHRVDNELRTNRLLDEKQRTYLFAIKDIAEIELSLFSAKAMIETAQSIEREVDIEMNTRNESEE